MICVRCGRDSVHKSGVGCSTYAHPLVNVTCNWTRIELGLVLLIMLNIQIKLPPTFEPYFTPIKSLTFNAPKLVWNTFSTSSFFLFFMYGITSIAWKLCTVKYRMTVSFSWMTVFGFAKLIFLLQNTENQNKKIFCLRPPIHVHKISMEHNLKNGHLTCKHWCMLGTFPVWRVCRPLNHTLNGTNLSKLNFVSTKFSAHGMN